METGILFEIELLANSGFFEGDCFLVACVCFSSVIKNGTPATSPEAVEIKPCLGY